MKEKVRLTASGKRDHRYGKRPASVGKNISKGLTASWARKRAEHPPPSEEERKKKRRERDRIMRERKRGGRPLKRPGRPRGSFRKKGDELESLRWRTYSAPPSKITVLVKIGSAAKNNDGLAIVLEEKASKKEIFSLFSGNHARQDIHSLEKYLKELGFSRIEVEVKTRKTVREMIEEADAKEEEE